MRFAWVAYLFVIVAPEVSGTSAPHALQADSSAFPSAAADAPIHLQFLTRDDGLSQAAVQAIAQDRRGFMWFGTQDGLNRYDGYTFTVFKTEAFDSTTLPGDAIWQVHEDQDGILWIAAVGGLGRMEPSTGRVQRYVHAPGDTTGLSSMDLLAVHRDRTGYVWVGTFNAGVNRLNARSGEVVQFRHDEADASSLSHDRVFAIHEDGRGRLWIATNNGVSRLDPESNGFLRYFYEDGKSALDAPVFGDNAFTSAVEDGQEPDVLWFGSARGLVRLDVGRGTHAVYAPEWADGGAFPIRCLIQDRVDPRILWLGTQGHGIYRFDIHTRSFEVHGTGQSHVETMYADRTGWIWVGFDGGVGRFHPERSRVFRRFGRDPNDPNSLSEAPVWDIDEDREGALWVGYGFVNARTGFLDRLDRRTGVLTTFRHDADDATSLGEGSVNQVAADRSGTLWIGAGATLNRMDPKRPGVFTRFEHDAGDPRSIRSGIVLTVYPGRSGVLWIGTPRGLDKMDLKRPGHFEHVCLEPSGPDCPDVFVRSLMEDHSGALWVGTWSGLIQLDRDGVPIRYYVHDVSRPNSLAGNIVTAILERSREPGVIWIASRAGLDRLDTRTDAITHFSEKDGLANNHVYGILEDDDGRLWLSTNGGLSRFDPETGSFKNFDRNDGLIQDEYNANSFLKSRSGELFFGGTMGIDYFFPADVRENTVPPDVVFTDVRLDHEPVMYGPRSPLKVPLLEAQELRLPPGRKALTFEFAALHYQNPAGNIYAYLLEGFDTDWIQAGTRRTATYTNLDPGDYVFRVKAANLDGFWNEEGIAMRVSVLPPWWRSVWAYAAYVLLGLAAVAVVDRTRRRRLIDRERRRAEREKARELGAVNEQLRAHETQLEKQNARLEEQARRLAEMDELKSRFFTNVSHEFRTPLTLILGPIRDALSDELDGEGLLRHAPMMHRNAQRLLRLINQLLDLSKLEAGAMQLRARRRDLVPFFRGLVMAFASRAERDGVTLSFSTEKESIELAFDAEKLEKVVTNLLSNAFNFTPGGGKIRVKLRSTLEAVDFSVQDTGEGVPAEELPHLFDRFYQVDGSSTRRHEGTGIGLALTKDLVELHGGAIDVESEPGFGTTFTVRLPIRAEAEPDKKDEVSREADEAYGKLSEEDGRFEPEAEDSLFEPDTLAGLSGNGGETGRIEEYGEILDEAAHPSNATLHPPDEAATPNAPTILLVEDNADVRAYVRSHLQGSYRLLEAADGRDGLRQAKEHVPDLVVSDVMMPEMDGFALCEAIKSDEALAHVPVVLLTAKADEASRIEGLESGADDYLAKPFSVEELTTRVENLIEIRRRLRARFSGEVRLGPEEVTVPSADAAFIERVRDVVEAEMGDGRFGVDRLAGEVGVSVRQLHRRVKEVTGLTPGGYVRMMRLQRAAQLLERQAGTVSEIAYRVGFNDANYFSRLFRQTFGRTPSEFAGTNLP